MSLGTDSGLSLAETDSGISLEEITEKLLPTATDENSPSRLVRLRCVTEPDAAQKTLLNRLGLTFPRRLRHLEILADSCPM